MPEDYQKVILNMHFPTAARYTIERFGLNESIEAIMSEWTEMAEQMYRDEVQAKPGACELIKRFKEQGLQLAIATSGQAKLYMPCLKRLGIADDFSIIIETEKLGCTKKDPRVYQTILDHWHIQPDECMVFEDILMAIQTTTNMGIFTIAVYDKSSQRDWLDIQKIADQTIIDFTELLR